MADAKRVLNFWEQASTPITQEMIDQVKNILGKYLVKSNRSFLGWDLSGGIADDRYFCFLDVKEEGFCLGTKSGKWTKVEASEAMNRFNEVLTCLGELEAVSPALVAK